MTDLDCKHDTWRNAVTFPVDARSMTQRRMEWCETCQKLLDDRSWKIPRLEDVLAKKPGESR